MLTVSQIETGILLISQQGEPKMSTSRPILRLPISRQPAKFAPALEIRHRVDSGQMTYEAGIAEAQAAGYVHLAQFLERGLRSLKEKCKQTLENLVSEGSLTTEEALRHAALSGVDDQDFRSRIGVAVNAVRRLTDEEIERRAVAIGSASRKSRKAA